MNRNARALRNRMCGGVLTALISGALCADAAAAQSVQVCDAAAQLSLVANPTDQNSKLYAQGNVLVAVVDDGRADVGTALSVLILSPPFDAHGARQCRRVSVSRGIGYAALLLDRAEASYDPAIGLTVSFPAVISPTLDSLGQKVDFSVIINQASGMISPSHAPQTE